MMQAIVIERIRERPNHMRLAHNVGEDSRPPLAREDLIAHVRITQICLNDETELNRRPLSQ